MRTAGWFYPKNSTEHRHTNKKMRQEGRCKTDRKNILGCWRYGYKAGMYIPLQQHGVCHNSNDR